MNFFGGHLRRQTADKNSVWMGGEVSQEDGEEEFSPSSSGEWCASPDDAAPVEDDDPVHGQ